MKFRRDLGICCSSEFSLFVDIVICPTERQGTLPMDMSFSVIIKPRLCLQCLKPVDCCGMRQD